MNQDMQNTVDVAVDATAEVLANVERHANSHKLLGVGRGIGLGLAAAGAVGAAYLLWRRSRPLEDPWAEEYWAKLTSSMDNPGVPVETAVNEGAGAGSAGAGAEVAAGEAPATSPNPGDSAPSDSALARGSA